MALVGSLSGSAGLIAVTGSFEPGTDNTYDSGTSSKKWKSVASTALTGSLTKLADGTDYLRAGSGITLATGSGGYVTVTSTAVTAPASPPDSIQYNNAGAFGGSANLTYDGSKVAITGSGVALEVADSTDGVFFQVNTTLSEITLTDPTFLTNAYISMSAVNGVIAHDNEIKLTISGTGPSTTRILGLTGYGTEYPEILSQITTDGVNFINDVVRFSGSEWSVNGQTGSVGQVLTSNGAGSEPTWETISTSTPGGSNYSVQFNSGSTFSGSSDLTWTYDTTKVLGVTGQISASLGITGSNIFAENFYASSLTPGRIVYTSNSGLLAVDSDMTYNDGSNTLTISGSTFGNSVTIVGDLTVNGTTTTINTENLIVEDALVVLGTGSLLANSNGGIAIFSGSSTADLVFGRVANDTWGVGSYNTQNGTIPLNQIPNMSLVSMRAATFEVNGTTSKITEAGGVLVASGSTMALSGSTISFVQNGTRIAYVGTSPDNLVGIIPDADSLYNLGSQERRWLNIYTGDLHLRNERGDYTLIEEEDFLSIRFNKTGKRYKFVLEPVPELDEK